MVDPIMEVFGQQLGPLIVGLVDFLSARVAWSTEMYDRPLILAFGLISVAMWQALALRVWWSSGHVEYLIILQEK